MSSGRHPDTVLLYGTFFASPGGWPRKVKEFRSSYPAVAALWDIPVSGSSTSRVTQWILLIPPRLLHFLIFFS